jgi:aminopeptidase N
MRRRAPPRPGRSAILAGVSRRTLAVALVGLVVAVGLGVAVVAARGDDDAAAPGSTTTTAAPTTTTAPPPDGTPGEAGVGDPYFAGLGNGGYQVDHYDLELLWQADEGRLVGVARIEATATQDLSRFNLDLAGMEVTEVTVAGRPATVGRDDRELQITPVEAIEAGRPFIAEVTYGGRPEPISEGTSLFEVGWQTDGREAFVVSEPSGAATFFPVNDHPTDKATYTLEVTAPDDQVVAASGLLVDQRASGDGLRTWTYEARDQMASYLVQVAIGDYELVDAGEVDGVVVRHAFHRSLVDAATDTTARTAEMMALLREVFGPYPFEAYGVVAVDEPLGFALETQTLTIIGSDVAARGRRSDQLLLHELAHQWVGNAVSPATWQDIWLNEGFATYAEWLWLERTGVADAAEVARSYQGSGDLDLPPGDPGADELFSGTVYVRGGMTLQALREEIGDDAFFELLRTWVATHDDGAASTEDLVDLAEEISGQDLDALFETWLYADTLPTL